MKSGTLILRVKPEGASSWGILQSVAYDDATPKTFLKARKEIEARRNGWQWNYDRYRNAQFEIVDNETGAEMPMPASEAEAKGKRATREQVCFQYGAMMQRLENATRAMNARRGKHGFGEWKDHVRSLARDVRAFRKAHSDVAAIQVGA